MKGRKDAERMQHGEEEDKGIGGTEELRKEKMEE